MVTQVEQGAYGQRSIEIIIAAIEAKKVDLQKSGRAAGGWLGGALAAKGLGSVSVAKPRRQVRACHSRSSAVPSLPIQSLPCVWPMLPPVLQGPE